TDLLQLLQSFKIKFAIHGFEGSVKNAIKVVDLGGFISVPPILLRDRNRQDIVKHIDLEYLLTETDSPFMSAEKLVRNEPCNVRLTIQKIAELKRTSNCEVEKKIENNFKRLISDVPLQ
ncbi:MAG: TatD family hydrolase, partial [Sulfolobus sp.]|nr:TatD family hydrolase [Sulfolobus sp.]